MTDLRNVNVKADYGQSSEPWKEYGILELPVMNTNLKGEMVGPSGMKVEIQKVRDGGEPVVRCILPAGMAFVPFEAIDGFMESDLEKRIRDAYPEQKDFRIESIRRIASHNGNTMHWTVQTNTIAEVKDSHVKNDQLKLGFCVRNGYNTGTALGIDLFTMRLVCSNGAFAKGTDLMSMSMRHVGNPKDLMASFKTSIMNLVEEWRELLKVYGRMAKVKLTKKMAQHLWDSTRHGWDINERFFPDYYVIPEKPKEREKENKMAIALTSAGKSVSLWENFNDMTYGLWRAQDETTYTNEKGKEMTRKPMAYDGVVARERKLHESIRFILDNPERFA